MVRDVDLLFGIVCCCDLLRNPSCKLFQSRSFLPIFLLYHVARIGVEFIS